MNEAVNPSSIVIWGGFVLAFVFGAVASKSNFCTMGAISDVVNMEHWGRVRMWLLAIAVAMIGANWLHSAGMIDLTKSVYQRPALPWLSMVVGGVLFGVGMTMSGGCANKNLIRVGAGSLRSVVVLVFLGLSAYMTLKGLFGQWRAGFLDPVTLDLSKLGMTNQSLSQLLAKLTGMAEQTALLLTLAVLVLAILAFVFKDKRFRGNLIQVVASVILGLLVVAAWYLSGHIGYGENQETLETVYFATNSRTIESFSFVAPVSFSLELLMLWTDTSTRMTFGIATALGVVMGSFVYAISTKQFRWEGFASIDDLKTQLIGAILMGFGGVTAIGCTVGQGMSGVSTLAIGSFITLAGIVAGAVAMMKWQQR
ncbi:MAG: YeeE/YedE family protein [Rhodoferax sp.]|uniref:YeeE/YedE family protein n=1 Tax=Rhodoferax sp. TaxID=50421 RepID=UPI001B52E06D|nr:YeeE/YedE family protein [Rhodoferax sp.]MBP9905081.1 YeeE/YedE family protein [Rhodoferax sp.]